MSEPTAPEVESLDTEPTAPKAESLDKLLKRVADERASVAALRAAAHLEVDRQYDLVQAQVDHAYATALSHAASVQAATSVVVVNDKVDALAKLIEQLSETVEIIRRRT